MAITTKRVREFAERMNFDMALNGTKLRLIARFEYEDGYRPSTIPLSVREAYMFLTGFSDGKHHSII